MTPELGRYFGVESGVLVLSAASDGEEDSENLQAGDVITEVDGTAVAHRGELFRNLTEIPRDVTVVRDGGTVVVGLSRDQLHGGTHAVRILRMGDDETQELDVIVNDALVGGDEGL